MPSSISGSPSTREPCCRTQKRSGVTFGTSTSALDPNRLITTREPRHFAGGCAGPPAHAAISACFSGEQRALARARSPEPSGLASPLHRS